MSKSKKKPLIVRIKQANKRGPRGEQHDPTATAPKSQTKHFLRKAMGTR